MRNQIDALVEAVDTKVGLAECRASVSKLPETFTAESKFCANAEMFLPVQHRCPWTMRYISVHRFPP